MAFKRNSIRFKIGILYSAVVACFLLVTTLALHLSLYQSTLKQVDLNLEKKAKEIAAVIHTYLQASEANRRNVSDAANRVIHQRNVNENKSHPGENAWQPLTIGNEYDLRSDYILFADESGTVITQSDNFPEDLRQLFIQKVRALGPQEKTVDTLTANDLRVRVFTFRSALTKNSHDIMQVGTDLRPTLDFLHKRLLLRLSAIPLIAVLTALFGLFLVRQILKPVREITSAAQKITHEDLNARIQTKHADEEMFFLVNAFNNMIARLESSFKYMKDFSSHAAHELKTPLAIIRGEAQIALKSTRSEQEYQRVLSVISGETSRMIRVVEDLLLMAKVDYESNVFQFEPFDFDEFLKDIHEQSKILAAHKNITVNLQPLDTPAIMNGDHLHLRRLFFNLIDNAIRFSPQDSRIDIAVQTANGQLKVSVSDYGTGITEEDLPRIFEKFFHRDRRPGGKKSGTGLGLALALSIAKAHGGNIEVKSQFEKGSSFIVTLPLA